jgi:hypothetical protein
MGRIPECGGHKWNKCRLTQSIALRGDEGVPGVTLAARANALQARTSQGADADAARVRALVAHQDFLTLWKDADPDILILKQAKAEYAKLQ